VALDHPRAVISVLALTVVLNVYLFAVVPKGFFPQEDTGSIMGMLRADQSISFQAMEQKLKTAVNIVKSDPAVENVVGFTGGGGGPGGGGNTANMFIDLKPLSERKISGERVIARLRQKLAGMTGARLFMQVVQDIRAGGRQSNSQYQYTLLADNLDQLNYWAPKITEALKQLPQLREVNSDQQNGGLDVRLNIDRATAARLGVNLTEIDNTLYDAFGQRQVSTIYNDMNQYHVVMEVEPSFWQNPETLRDVWVSTSGGALSGTQATAAAVGAFTPGPASGSSTSAAGSASATANQAARNAQLNALTNSGRGGASTGTSLSTSAEDMVPLSSVASYGPGLTPMSVMHQGAFAAATISFDLPVGEPLGVATQAIDRTMQQLHVPIGVHGSFAGTAQVFQQTLAEEGLLILAAIIAVYIVLGMLYESFVHPITILSTLPSAGIGAVLALILFNTEFSLVALIGVILLIGIVKKNAIIMIDVAISTERENNVDARTAIHEACLLRFRPIMMTTFAALFGALPLALTTGNGAELRQPLGIAIVGGLLLSQVLTLYTTPIVYLYLDRFRVWTRGLFHRGGRVGGAQQRPA
jgi:multidrug efflux pump